MRVTVVGKRIKGRWIVRGSIRKEVSSVCRDVILISGRHSERWDNGDDPTPPPPIEGGESGNVNNNINRGGETWRSMTLDCTT